MSIAGGLSALRMEMPEKIPRTEYSAHFHWELVKKVTGIEVASKSGTDVKEEAARQFVRAWDYGFYTEFLKDIVDCGVHGFVFEPSMNLTDICEQYGKPYPGQYSGGKCPLVSGIL